MTPIEKPIAGADANRLNSGWAIAAGALAGLYAALATSVSDSRVSLLLLAAPLPFVGLFLKNSARIYLMVLVVSLSFGVRFRFSGLELHQGGAEAALAPIDFPLAGLLLIWLSQSDRNWKIPERVTRIGAAFLLFVLVHVVSVVAAFDSGLALIELLRLVKMGLLILVVRHFVRTEDDLLLALKVLLGAVIAQGVLAVSQAFFNSSLGLGFLGEHDTLLTEETQGLMFERAGGTLGHANVLGYFFEMTLPLALAILFWIDRGRIRLLSLAALGLGLFGALLTYSRSSWAAILVGLSVVAFATLLLRQRSRAWLRYFGVVLLVLLVIAFVFREAIFQRINLFASASWDFRLQTFQLAWDLIQKQPLLGIGANNYLAVVHAYGYMSNIALVVQAPVHNLFLLITTETGLIGIIAFVSLLFSIGAGAYRTARRGSAPVAAGAIGILAGLAALTVQGMLDWVFRFDPAYTLFWFEVGLLLALSRMARKPAFHAAV